MSCVIADSHPESFPFTDAQCEDWSVQYEDWIIQQAF